MNTLDLSGAWRYSLEDRPEFSTAQFNDSHWARMNIPQNWFLAGVEHHGVVWFRYSFHYEASDPNVRQRIQFEGVDYFADAYLNGQHLGHHAGYFEPFAYDVSDILQDGINILAVRVDSPFEPPGPNGWYMHKQLIKGILNHHDCRPGGGWDDAGQSHNTGGIWNSVRLIEHGEVSIAHQFLTARLDGETPELQIDLVIHNHGDPIVATAGTLVVPENFTAEQQFQAAYALELPNGISTHSLILPVPEVQRWQPWERGYPHLYTVQLILEPEDQAAIIQKTSFGFRTVSVDQDFNWTVNDEPFYMRGSNYIASQWLSETLFTEVSGCERKPFPTGREENDPAFDWFERDVSLMVAANLNIIRVHAHVIPEAFHTACDRAGLLVWQDFPMQWGYSGSEAFAAEAEKQVKAMVRLLYNRPSIIAWCVHNESPWGAEWMAENAGLEFDPEHNRQLDENLAAVLRRMDSTRYTHVNSGVGDGHAYPGWYIGHWKDYADLPAVPFPTEYGAQALPVKSNLVKMFPDLGPDGGFSEMVSFMDWLLKQDGYAQRRRLPDAAEVPNEHRNGYYVTRRWMFHDFQPFETFLTANIPRLKVLEHFIEESQSYQSWLIQFATETYRRNRAQTRGVFQFMITDPWPSITWSVLDYWRTPKPSYEVLERVMQPVLPSVDGIVPEMQVDDPQDWTLSVTNDRLNGYPEARCEWMFASGLGEEQRGSFDIDIPAFSVSKPKPLPEFKLQPGENYLALFVYDQNGEQLARNHYFFTAK